MARISFFFLGSLLFLFSCNSPQVTAYQEHSDHHEFIGSCLDFLAGSDSFVPLTDAVALDELRHSAEEHASNSVIIGDLYYDLNQKEGRHFYLESDDSIAYYRPQAVVLGGWEMIQHLCARHIRHEIERGFAKSSSILKKNPASIKEAEILAEKNLILYLKFAEASKGKPSHIRNFLFIPVSRFLKKGAGIYFPSCNLMDKMKDPILYGLQSAKRNPETMTAWTQMMLAVTNFSATHMQDCKVSVESPLKLLQVEKTELRDVIEEPQRNRSASKIKFGSKARK
ncbi:hypothetical protein [Leptospira haakeii]|uniref:Lipoprotein n=1 Tax=Leptospira haakeii TaxID=2023198 RepID=A0ABX4PLJ9_9LEPT|nr:hypothetical protein [Leptospira haakeii]PKA15791.1 hypothetical protein CH363_12345 [Leptospira haakeii]PKA18074.1 hypothetical protein CH377_19520 [Leptospira haakeii]